MTGVTERLGLPRLPALARARGPLVGRLGDAVLLALPGVLVVYTGFHAGGFFADTQAVLGVALAAVLLLRVTFAHQPFGGANLAVGLTAGALSLLAGLILLSAEWSHAPARALLEFDRALVYVLAVLLFGSLAMTRERLSWMLRGLALAAIVVCTAGLITRLLPEVWPIAPNIGPTRLSYPVTYWNTLGLIGALGTILCLHLTCSEREPRWVRVAAAPAIPLLASTVYLTLSRGAMGSGLIGVAAYLLLGRPRALLGGLLAAGPAAVFAVRACYRGAALVSTEPTSALAVAQGKQAASTVALCAIGAAAVRLLLLPPDSWLAARRPRRAVLAGATAVAVIGVVAAVATLDVPRRVSEQYEAFLRPGADYRLRADPRQRIFNPTNNGRIDLWAAALKGYRAAPWRGQGAGTYQVIWFQHRPFNTQDFDAHSLYLEMLSELGIPGLALTAVALLTIMVGTARRIRGPDRAMFAAVFAAMLTWTVRAGADWDWEMPVVTLWLFAVGGATLATPLQGKEPARRAHAVLRPGPTLRLLIAIGCLVLAVAPARVAVSQWQLNRSVRAFDRGDCREAVDASLDSISAMGVRSEPFQILGWCDVRLGRPDLAIRAMSQAVSRDPRNWEYHYGLALVRGAARLDPRPAASQAARLNPHEPLADRAVQRFRTADPQRWRALALGSRLPSG
jgi:hypothetical protein